MSKTTIPLKVKLLLMAHAAGRCQFRGCNKRVTEHRLTGRQGPFGAFAHIVADSEDGPRGDAVDSPRLAKDLSNLMLLCADDHKLIDDPATGAATFPVAVLREMKAEHESRVATLTDIKGLHRTHLLLMEAPIGERRGLVQRDLAEQAALPRWPQKQATEIALSDRLRDGESLAWEAGAVEVQRAVDAVDELRARKEVEHVSVFALAPIPLLIWLGYRLGDIQPADVFMKRRDTQGWEYEASGADLGFSVAEEGECAPGAPAVLAVDVSDRTDRPPALAHLPVVRVAAEQPAIGIVTCRSQVSAFLHVVRLAMTRLRDCSEVHVIAAVPNALAVEFGRLQLPKAHPPLNLYDRHDGRGALQLALVLRGGAYSART